MIPLSGQEIRQRFIQFFHQQCGHQIQPSASLIPTNPTVLLTPAGMLPFVPVFMGIEPPPNPPRVVSIQKCARISGKASDLEFVGRTARHHTFFEMLGNFSFGDYFKREVIPWAWTFVTQELGLPKERLWVTVYYKDQEARQIWEDVVGLPRERVLDMDEKDNFWGPPGPTGPCGPCSEIYYDWGPAFGGDEHSTPLTYDDGDRFMEFWNLVFMEFFKDEHGHLHPLDKKNIDTGMGLERMAMIMQGVRNTFETDLLFPIVKKIAALTDHRYHESDDIDVWLKIVADHMRCVTFALADGVIPSNEGRGYIIRMVLRRAVRYAKKLGVQNPTLFKLVSTIRDQYQEAYPELKTQYERIVETVKTEEQRFLETLERGSRLLDDLIQRAKTQQKTTLPGEDVFKLYDTYGFPWELTQEIAQEAGLAIDKLGFDAAMAQQKEQARASQGKKIVVSNPVYADILNEFGPTEFLGYDVLESDATILAILQDNQRVPQFGGTNQAFELVLDRTPFYGESGGQVGDRGIIYIPQGQQAQTIVVQDTVKVGHLFIHRCLFDQGGSVSEGQTVHAEVNPESRAKTAANHSATHLLHAALKKNLGAHVSQAGSYVGPESARFDFNFSRALTKDELARLEITVNQWIFENITRDIEITDVESAKAQGAVAAFDEKYSDAVRVITFGPHSKELCGGTHVERLGDIGLFKITSEVAIASGIRRVEFVTGALALHQMLQVQNQLESASSLLKVPPRDVPERVERLLEEKKAQEKTLRQLQEKLAMAQVRRWVDESVSQRFIVQLAEVDHADVLKFMAETLSAKLPDHVVLLGANIQGKAQFVASVPPTWVKQGVKAGDLVKQAASMCQGGGGGSPAFAQAGGKAGHLVAQALDAVKQHVASAVMQTAGGSVAASPPES